MPLPAPVPRSCSSSDSAADRSAGLNTPPAPSPPAPPLRNEPPATYASSGACTREGRRRIENRPTRGGAPACTAVDTSCERYVMRTAIRPPFRPIHPVPHPRPVHPVPSTLPHSFPRLQPRPAAAALLPGPALLLPSALVLTRPEYSSARWLDGRTCASAASRSERSSGRSGASSRPLQAGAQEAVAGVTRRRVVAAVAVAVVVVVVVVVAVMGEGTRVRGNGKPRRGAAGGAGWHGAGEGGTCCPTQIKPRRVCRVHPKCLPAPWLCGLAAAAATFSLGSDSRTPPSPSLP